ncbi:hypothetical protein [Photorhabdus asymbiotica]
MSIVDNNSLAHVLAPAEENKKGTVEKWQQDKQTERCRSQYRYPISC